MPGEYADYAQADLDVVEGDDAVAALALAAAETLGLFEVLDEAAVSGVSYAPGKWTIKEIVGHLADDERIFAYRALTIARGDDIELAGFDEKPYASSADFERRPLVELHAEYGSVRQLSLTMFAGFPAEAWQRRGTVSGYRASVRGLAFHIAAHELHHVRVLRQRYLPLMGR